MDKCSDLAVFQFTYLSDLQGQSRQLLSLHKNVHNSENQKLRGCLNRTQSRSNASRCVDRCFLRQISTFLGIMIYFHLQHVAERAGHPLRICVSFIHTGTHILLGHLYALSLPVILLLQICKGMDKRIYSVISVQYQMRELFER